MRGLRARAMCLGLGVVYDLNFELGTVWFQDVLFKTALVKFDSVGPLPGILRLIVGITYSAAH